MIKSLRPVFDSTDTPFYFTLDGRLGAILEFDTLEEQLEAFALTTSSFRFFHSQALDFFGRKLVTISKYTETPKDGIFSPFQKLDFSSLSESFLEAIELVHEFKSQTTGKYITTYPEIPCLDEYHVYKLKYTIDWSTDHEKIKFLPGYALLHFPSDTALRMMYVSQSTLRDLLSQMILCVEFVEQYKTTAANFCYPLGAVDYFAKLFKL